MPLAGCVASLHFVYSGNPDTDGTLRNAGNDGNFWSSTANPDPSNAFNLNFNESEVNANNNDNRYNGNSVRCLAPSA